MASNGANGLRTQYPYGGDALSPRPLYDFPSPTSNYPSGIGGGASPGFYPMAYQNTPRFYSSAFIPPPDVFVDGRKGSVQENGMYTPREFKKRNSDMLHSDPVAMHLLVETAMGDSQYFEVLSVEEVEALKQEQKALDSRLGTVRRKLESETKIRDAARSLTRLISKKENGHRRGLSSRGSNPTKDTVAKSEEELSASNKKVDDLTRELVEVESRMRMIDMQLLMHTAGVLQMTHNGPSKRKKDSKIEGGGQRPDSPASIYTYENSRTVRDKGDDMFDERSLYRSPENLDSLMQALQNGTHHHSQSIDRQSQSLNSVAQRLEELNERLRGLIVDANPDRNRDYSLPPKASGADPDASSVDRQLDFLDQGLRDIGAEQADMRNSSQNMLAAVEERLEGINNQLYAMLSRADPDGGEKVMPPPPISGGSSQEQLNYMEDSFYNLGQIQYSLNDQLEELRSKPGSDAEAERYESTLVGLWQIILAGEEEARERKRERRQLLAEDPDAEEELSPDEDYNPNEQFSLSAFSAKVQFLFRRATSLKDKQAILLRQIKQQRELNSKSDAQKEAEFERLNEQVLSARSEKKTMENELERAMGQLRQFDEQKAEEDTLTLQNVQSRNTGLEAQLKEVQERSLAYENQLKDVQERSVAYENQLKDVQERSVAYENQLKDSQERSIAYESQLKESQELAVTYENQLQDLQERSTAYEDQLKDAQERSMAYEAQLRDAQERTGVLEAQLREAQDDARVEAATIQAELAQSSAKIEEAMAALAAATAEKEAAETRSVEATNALNAKEEELRDLEGEVVRLTTELTFAKAELDGAYGSRAERAAESAANPNIKRELDELAAKNTALLDEIQALRAVQDVASQSEVEARESERNLKAELSAMAAEYEALTRDSIQNEKDRDSLEASIDRLRDEKEALEMELSDERVKWLGVRSPGMPNGAAQADMGATSIRMLREDFRKMMRDRTAEGLKALRAEQEERRKLEALVRSLRKDALPPKSGLSKTVTAS
ncbi:involucrin repeat protein-like protein [Corynespora cassiicola Philippines]|uniref:Involucrin repeat protein-like protein n=1 Tax=Corynespora cassiicola Philippines TaxID=1448308 RepID=A0A2T2N6A8_CORCC|nr:involucrin repeat protein-like protein [Corynespora cassiicola Philippines]